MAGVSHLDELIDYKEDVIDLLGGTQAVVGLLVDDPNINMDTDKAYSVYDNNLYNYDYVDETVQEAKSYIMVETETEPSSPTMKDVYLTIQIVVHKSLMKLDRKLFRGVKGNRKDNLARQIDLLLRDNKDFGIGGLELIKIVTAPVPENYTSRLLVYKVPNFARDRGLGNV